MSKSTSDEGEGGDAIIHLRVPPALKGRWVRESRAVGMRLTDWIIQRVEARPMNVYPIPEALASKYHAVQATPWPPSWAVRWLIWCTLRTRSPITTRISAVRWLQHSTMIASAPRCAACRPLAAWLQACAAAGSL